MNRRQFLSNSSQASLAALLASRTSLFQGPNVKRVGLNLFSCPKLLESDVAGTLKLLAGMGYKDLELYGPYSFSTEAAKKHWEAIVPQVGFSGSGFFGKDAKTFRKMLDDSGLKAPSLHTDLDTLSTSMGNLAEGAHAMSSRYVVLPSIPDDKRKTLDDYKKMAELFNKIGAEAKKNGIRYAYHNHGYGLSPMEGQIPLDIIFKNTDPDLVFFEMDLYWTTAGGADPIKLLTEHKGRYRLMHVKDMKQKVRFSGDGGDPKQWIELWDYMTTVGDGVLDIPNIVKTAKANGMEHFIVEQDIVKLPEIALKKSYDHLQIL